MTTVTDKKKLRPTIYDVAKLAEVSASTVSRFLNRTTFISEAKRVRIEKAIAELSYKPQYSNSDGRGGRSMTVGLLVQDADSPYSNEVVLGIERELNAKGYSALIISGHWDNKTEYHSMGILSKHGVDGIIVVNGSLNPNQFREFSGPIPVVSLGQLVQGEQLHAIKLENSVGAYMATNHLIQQGHRQIIHMMGMVAHHDAQQRLEGYKKALRDAGIPYRDEFVIYGEFNSAASEKAMLQFLDKKLRFSAVFAANDQSAYGVVQALHKRKLKVPENISVIGFDDLDVSRYFVPPLTTIRQPLLQTGAAVAQAMLSMLSGGEFDYRIPPIELIVRESTRVIQPS